MHQENHASEGRDVYSDFQIDPSQYVGRAAAVPAPHEDP